MRTLKVTSPDWDLEQLKTYDYIIGVDEVGRGPVAGPIYATAVRMQVQDIQNFKGQVTDSKAMSEKQRLAAFVQCQACTHHIAQRDAAFINQYGIQPANKQIFVEAIEALLLPNTNTLVVVDGTLKLGLSCTMLVLPKAETISLTVAIASVLAKVTRDAYMAQAHLTYPYYDWVQNKGYGTPKHVAGLRHHGITSEHRTLFVNTLLS